MGQGQTKEIPYNIGEQVTSYPSDQLWKLHNGTCKVSKFIVATITDINLTNFKKERRNTSFNIYTKCKQ